MAPKTPSVELVRAMKELRLGQIVPTLADRITLAEKGDLPIEAPARTGQGLFWKMDRSSWLTNATG